MIFDGSRVLITGGAGFIGANLALALLKAKSEVTVFDDFSVGTELNLKEIANDMVVVKGDVRDIASVRKAVEDQDYIFHMAANASVPISSEDPRYDFEVNANGTFNMLEAIRNSDSSAPLVFASSAAVYGESTPGGSSEECQLGPVSPYGASKLAAEVLCRTFNQVYGLPTVCLRFFNVYGPLQRKYVMFDIMSKLQRQPNRLEILGTGGQVRDFIYVSDAVDACLMLATTPSAVGEVYNVGTGVATSIRELVELIFEVVGLQEKPEILFTNESWKGDVQTLLADVKKIRKVGFQPRVDLRTGLTRFINWYNVSYNRK